MSTKNQCKNCGSRLSFDIESQSLKCSHCDSTVQFEKEKATNSKFAFSFDATEKLSSAKTEQHKCIHCGNILIVNGEYSHLVCPSCGSNDFEKTVAVNVEPDGIVSFKITKEQAGNEFKKWLKKQWLAPSNLKKLAKLKKLTGAYVPFWNYDFAETYTYSGVGVVVRKDRNGKSHRSYFPFKHTKNGSETDYFVQANEKVSTEYIQKLEDFRLAEMDKFKQEYMYGLVGFEKSIGLQDSYKNLNRVRQAENDREAKMSLRLKYDQINNFSSSLSLRDVIYNYIYLPVWINHYSYKNKHYNCYVNGVTGKTAGKAPVSVFKVMLSVLGVIAIAGLFYYLKNK